MKVKTDIARLLECRLPPTRGFRSHLKLRYHGALRFSKESQERGLIKAREARRKAREMKRSEKIGKKYRETPSRALGVERHTLEVLRDISETLAMIYDAMAEDPEEVDDDSD